MRCKPHLIEVHIPRLRRYALALLKDRTRADDLVQDTLERALNKFSLWQRHSDLRAWLFTIMHNLHSNQCRSASKRSHLNVGEADINEIASHATQEGNIEIRDINRALHQLPEEFRQVLLLVGLEQMKYEEVARILNIPKGTVMSRLSRGREKLRQIMAGNNVTSLRRVK